MMKKHTGNKSKLIRATVCCLLLPLFVCGAFTGCGGRIADDDQTLEIFIGNFGYGYDWLNKEIESFKNQEWVKEKYPNLNIPVPAYNSDTDYVANRITAGSTATSTDLFFGTNPAAAFFNQTDASGNFYFEDLTELYGRTVPGESVTVAQKMRADILNIQHVEKMDGTKAYFGIPWVDGSMGLFYNKTLINQYLGESYEPPRTTAELEKMTSDLKKQKDENGKAVVPFISASRVSYWTQVFVMWWAQYEGIKGYENYFNGINVFDERDSGVIAQTGRKRALEALEALIAADKGNNHPEINTMEFTTAQSKFLLGQGMIMPNGDWFETEMISTSAENPHDYEITMIKTPVISSIIEKCNSIDNEAMLSDVVKAIDNGKTYAEAKLEYATLSETDYQKVSQARNISYKIEGHEAYIPSYATAKELAKDFLLFLSTDEACRIFMDATNGCSTPYTYEVQQKAPQLYERFSTLQQDRLTNSITAQRLKPQSAFRLANYGGLTFFAKTPLLEIVFTASNSADRKTAQKIYQDDIDYYQGSGETNWSAMLMRAGL